MSCVTFTFKSNYYYWYVDCCRISSAGYNKNIQKSHLAVAQENGLPINSHNTHTIITLSYNFYHFKSLLVVDSMIFIVFRRIHQN